MIRSLYLLLGLGALLPTALAAPVTALAIRDAEMSPECADGVPFGESRYEGIPWEKPLPNGQKGDYFCATKWKDGRIITGLTIFGTKGSMFGIQVRYDDKSISPIFGKMNNEKQEVFNWDVGASIDKLQTWQNKKNDGLGKLSLTVSGKELIYPADTNKKDQGTSHNKHSGVLLAVRGRHQDIIRTLEFKFMSAATKEVNIIELKFPEDLETWRKNHPKSIEYMSLAEVYIKNTNPDKPGMNKTYSFTGGLEESVEKTISHGTQTTFSTSITLTVGGKIGIPLVAEGEASASWQAGFELSTMHSTALTESKKSTLTWNDNGNIDPGYAAHCKSWAVQGVYDSDYTAIVEVVTVDNTRFRLEQPGHVKSIGWSLATAHCDIIPLKDVPKSPFGKEQVIEAGKESTTTVGKPIRMEPPIPNTEQPPVPNTEEPPVPNPEDPPLPNPEQPPVINTNTEEPPVPTPEQPPVPTPEQPPVPTPEQPPVPNPEQPPVPNPEQPPVTNPEQPPVPNPEQPPVPNPEQPPVSNPEQPPVINENTEQPPTPSPEMPPAMN